MQTPRTSSASNLTGPGTDNGAQKFPFTAHIEGPYGDCAGVLVAPGYVLTTASCVWEGELAEPADLKVTVGGEEVQAVKVHVKTAKGEPWKGFEHSKDKNAWDIALIALERDASVDRYATLPTFALPSDARVWATAWKDGKDKDLEYAPLQVQPCTTPGWADHFCAGPPAGGAMLKDACPKDKGAPVIWNDPEKGDYVIGITSGKQCNPERADQGLYINLSQKCTLNKVVEWLLSREGPANADAAASSTTGLDGNTRQLIQRAFCYLYAYPTCSAVNP